MSTSKTRDLGGNAAFWDKIARKYAKHKIANQAAYEATLQRVSEHLGPKDHVLELGAGTGSTALLLAGNVASYLSTDFAPEMMQIAQEKLAAQAAVGNAPEGLTFLAADGFDERVDPPAGSPGYDAVLAFNFLHLVQNPEDLAARINALLKPGGLFISKTVCLGSRAWLFGPLIGIMRLIGKAPFVNLMSPNDVDDVLKRAGFDVIETDMLPPPRSYFVVARKI